MVLSWRADYGPPIVVFGSSLPSSIKNVVKVGPSLTKLSGCVFYAHYMSLSVCMLAVSENAHTMEL